MSEQEDQRQTTGDSPVASSAGLGHDGKELPSSPCPTCGYVMDDATCISQTKGRPSSGDLSLCMKCGEILLFTDRLNLRVAELNDMIGLPKETNDLLTRAQKLIRRERKVS